MARTVVIVRDSATLSVPVATALEQCFRQRGWETRTTSKRIVDKPDLVAGWGFRDVMHEAWDRWPDRVLHVDAGFWGRIYYNKLALGGRWSPLRSGEFDVARLKAQRVQIQATCCPGKRIVVCGMSAKAAISWGMKPESWEREAVKRLRAAGAQVTYRPKPSWQDAIRLEGADYDRVCSIDPILKQSHGVVSHHSNAAIDALVAGLPIYVEVGIAKSQSVPKLESIVGAMAPDLVTRTAFLRQVAWHQWTVKELAEGAWLEPPAPLAGHPTLAHE